MISFDEFIQAQSIVDIVQGTGQIKRPVERDLRDQWRGYENKAARLADMNSGAIVEIEISGVARFWQHVGDIASWLESDGSFYHPGKRCYYTKPKRIAHELAELGLCWVQPSMVAEAQTKKAA